jgi:hypothetical protein
MGKVLTDQKVTRTTVTNDSEARTIGCGDEVNNPNRTQVE